MEALLGLLTSLRPDLVNLTIALVGIGALIKYRGKPWMKKYTELIPIVLLAIAFIVCGLSEWFHSSESGATRVYDAIVLGGLRDGIIVTATSVLSWSALHGLYKHKKKREVEKNETDGGVK